jgi:hypothetical protein
MQAPCRDAMRPDLRGDGAPRSAKSLWLVPCGTQAPRGAPHALWENGWHILFHGATVRQERNDHDLMRDFADEIPGYQW